MKKIFIILVISLFLVAPTLALNLGTSEATKTAQNAGYSPDTSEVTFSQNIGIVIRAALSLVGVIFLVLMVYAGYLWMTARGEEAQIDKAKKIISSSIIGLIILLAAYSITTFVVPRIIASVAT